MRVCQASCCHFALIRLGRPGSSPDQLVKKINFASDIQSRTCWIRTIRRSNNSIWLLTSFYEAFWFVFHWRAHLHPLGYLGYSAHIYRSSSNTPIYLNGNHTILGFIDYSNTDLCVKNKEKYLPEMWPHS